MVDKDLYDWLFNALLIKTGQSKNSAQPFVECRVVS